MASKFTADKLFCLNDISDLSDAVKYILKKHVAMRSNVFFEIVL
jgi:hypothetical protein